MSKIRVHELAKQLNVENKALLDKLDEFGITGKKHSSSLEEDEIKKVLSHFSSKQAKPAEKAAERPADKHAESVPQRREPIQRQTSGEATPAQNTAKPAKAPQGLRQEAEAHSPSKTEKERTPVQRHAPQRIAYSSDRPNVNRTINVHQRPPQQKPVPTQGAQKHPAIPQRPESPAAGNTEKTANPAAGEVRNTATPETVKPSVIQAQPVAEQKKTVEHIDKKPAKPELAAEVKTEEVKITDKTVTLEPAKVEEKPAVKTNTATQPTSEQRPSAGDRPAHGARAAQGDRPPYQQRTGAQGDRPPYQQRTGQSDRPPYQPRTGAQGDRPPYQQRTGQGDRPPYQPRTGAQGDRPPYQQRTGQGDRPPYQPRTGTQGDRPPYQQRTGQGDRPPYQQRTGQGDRPPYQQRTGQGDRPPYQQRTGQGDRPPYQQRTGQGDRPPYQQRPPFGGGRPSDSGFGKDKPGFDKSRSPRPDFKSRDKAPAAAPPKQDKDYLRRITKDPVRKDRITDQEEGLLSRPSSKKPAKAKSNEPIVIQIPEKITLKALAEKMNVAGNDLIKALMKKGMMKTLNTDVDFETASSIAVDYNILVEQMKVIDPFEDVFAEKDDEKDLVGRPPVVVVMGHVDHGKTSLLDAIRSSKVASGEAGGITQHIGAYTVTIHGKAITFLDTPGHEAFTAMRMRGAMITDIAILVVAADDGVMPQTIEAINHAKAAGVEIIVAINKIDKPSANPDRVKRELTEHEIVTEDWGGSTISVPVSAVNHTGIDQLLEMILLAAEMKELRANPSARARGTIIEASLDKGKGPVATVLVQNGTLSIGDPIVAGGTYGKIRAMMDDKGNKVKKAPPSTPVEILGLPDVPLAGDLFFVAESDKYARNVAEQVVAKNRVKLIGQNAPKVSLDDLFEQIKAGNIKDLNIIVKADVAGSVEAIRSSLEKLSNDEVRVRIIHGGVGAINESDVMLASTSGAIIIGFNVRPEPSAKSVADEQEVDLRLYRVIYNAIEDVQAAMKGMLDPVYEERVIGHAEIRQIFKATAIGNIGGSYILDGKFVRNAKVRIIRDGAVVHEGELESLKRFKDDVKEVLTGYECGLVFSKFNDIKEGDRVEAYLIEQVER